MLHKENAIYTSIVAFTLLQLKHQTVFCINLHRKQTVIRKRNTRKMQFTHLLLKHQTVFWYITFTIYETLNKCYLNTKNPTTF